MFFAHESPKSILAMLTTLLLALLFALPAIADGNHNYRLLVNRTIDPEVVRNGKTATVQYELYNAGNVEIKNIRVEEDTSISTNAQTVTSLAPGDRTTVKFTVTMRQNDLTSQGKITYKAGDEALSQELPAVTIAKANPGLVLDEILTADKTSIENGDTVTLTLTIRNNGNITYSNISVTDAKYGEIFTKLTLGPGETLVREKQFTLSESTSFKYSITLPDNTGNTNTVTSNEVRISVYSPGQMMHLTLDAAASTATVAQVPADVRFTLKLTNNSSQTAKNVTLYHGATRITTVSELAPSQTVTIERDFTISQAGKFRFTASIKDALDNTQTFDSNEITIAYAAQSKKEQNNFQNIGVAKPAAAAAGWDVVDLTAYPVSEGSLTTVTRKEMLEGGLLVINRWHMMPSDLTDDMMVSISRTSRADEDKNNNIPTTNSSLTLQPVAVNALMKLYGDARAEGLDMDGIIVSEGYRTMEQQTSLWNKKVESLSGSYSGERLNEMAMRSMAYPGTSDYQTGLSVFVYNYKKGDNEFTSTLLHETEQGKWLYQNCWKYGYIFRYPIQGFPYADTVDKSFKTGYTDQMKVYRYVGVANAAAMNTLGMCLEEYVEYLMAHPHIAVYSDGTLKYEIYRMEGGYADTAVTVPYGATSYSASTDNMDGLIVAITY